jgi:hypothetical protein
MNFYTRRLQENLSTFIPLRWQNYVDDCKVVEVFFHTVLQSSVDTKFNELWIEGINFENGALLGYYTASSVNFSYHNSLRNVSEERSSHLLRGRSLKSQILSSILRFLYWHAWRWHPKYMSKHVAYILGWKCDLKWTWVVLDCISVI